jgi:hypothetical protein
MDYIGIIASDKGTSTNEPHFKNMHGGTEEKNDNTVMLGRLSQDLCLGFPNYRTQILTAAQLTFGFKYRNLKSCFSQNQHANKPINTFLKIPKKHSILGELRANNGFLIKSLFSGG